MWKDTYCFVNWCIFLTCKQRTLTYHDFFIIFIYVSFLLSFLFSLITSKILYYLKQELVLLVLLFCYLCFNFCWRPSKMDPLFIIFRSLFIYACRRYISLTLFNSCCCSQYIESVIETCNLLDFFSMTSL